jgi:5-methylcytosine-specific restriction enzyme subunit McrC
MDSIPIQNIYYLLCYAWDKLAERDVVSVESIHSTSLANLFARVLINGTQHLLKRGLDRSYVHQEEWTTRLRGRIGFEEVAVGRTHTSGALLCRYDDMSHDVLHNRILKTTIASLIHTEGVEKVNADGLSGLLRHLPGIGQTRLNDRVFGEVRLNRNNQFYEFLMRVCEIVYRNLLVSENTGKAKFRDFVRDREQMARLFEHFVRNFYRTHASDKYKEIGSEQIRWRLDPVKEDSASWLPRMVTDVTLTSEHRKIIIDCKYTPHIFQSHRDSMKFRSEHLYQIYAYLSNLSQETYDKYADISVLLLYPAVAEKHAHWFTSPKGYRVGVHNINLAQPWPRIHDDLLALVL